MPSFICRRRSAWRWNLSPPQLTWPQPTGLNGFPPPPLTTITFARSLCCPVVHWKTSNGSDSMVLPSEAHVQFQPKPDWLHLSTKAVQSIYWNRDVCEMPSTWFIFGVKAVVNDNYPFDSKREPDCEEWKCVIPILSNRVQSLCGLKNKIKR